MIDRLRGLPDSAVIALSTLAVASPLLAAVVALRGTEWVPVLDLAMTEFRVSDVGTRDTPLIGLPGRIGALPEQGSHPGPLSFWALAPGYRLFGGSAWALEASTTILALGWIALAMWIANRRLGRPGIAMVAAISALLIRGFGLSVLTQPWNPYMPLLAWLVVLLATWSVLCGDDWMLVPLLVAASFAAQTHIPYLTMAGSLGLVAFGTVAARWWRSRADGGPPRSLVMTAGAFLVLWIGPLADQLRRDPGNIRRLIDHFSAPSENPIGLGGGIRLTLRHLDVFGAFLQQVTGTERFLQEGFDPDGTILPGIALLVLWAAAFAVSARLRHSDLVRLHAVIAIALGVGVVSMSRIFGLRWFYLTLWAWVTATLVLVAIAWTAVAALRTWRPTGGSTVTPVRLAGAGVALAAVGTAATLTAAPSTEHPEEYLGATVAELLGPIEQQLDPDASYVVEWKDAYFFGSQAFGLVNELRRAGFDVGTTEFWRVPATDHRTKPITSVNDSLVFVTGNFVEQWQNDERFEQLALVDPRTPDERTEFESLREQLIDELSSAGLNDLASEVDANLFGVNIDLRISERARQLSARMIRIGQTTAVFLGPPGTAL